MTTTKEAAINWFINYDGEKNFEPTDNDEAILSLWMNEVVLPWWSNCDYADKMALAKTWLSTLPESFTNEIISSIYLKEHEGKEGNVTAFDIASDHLIPEKQPEVSLPVSEEWILISDREPKINQLVTVYFSDGTESDGLWDWQNERDAIVVTKWKPLATPISTEETVEDIKLAEKLLRAHPDFDAEGLTEYQNGRFNGLCEGLAQAKSILKEVDKQAALLHEQNGIIYDLLHALSNAMQYVPFDCGTKEDCRSAITKAEQFLGTK